jgi:hypothetical protein
MYFCLERIWSYTLSRLARSALFLSASATSPSRPWLRAISKQRKGGQGQVVRCVLRLPKQE